jgi:hypothetical protein
MTCGLYLQTAAGSVHSEDEEGLKEFSGIASINSNSLGHNAQSQYPDNPRRSALIGRHGTGDEQMQAVLAFWGPGSSGGILNVLNAESNAHAKAPCAAKLRDAHQDKFHDLAKRTFGREQDGCDDIHCQAAVGLAQLEKAPIATSKREHVAPPVDTRSAASFRCTFDGSPSRLEWEGFFR